MSTLILETLAAALFAPAEVVMAMQLLRGAVTMQMPNKIGGFPKAEMVTVMK